VKRALLDFELVAGFNFPAEVVPDPLACEEFVDPDHFDLGVLERDGFAEFNAFRREVAEGSEDCGHVSEEMFTTKVPEGEAPAVKVAFRDAG
jgi:hypothetical protein